jgi:hypothetical protein
VITFPSLGNADIVTLLPNAPRVCFNAGKILNIFYRKLIHEIKLNHFLEPEFEDTAGQPGEMVVIKQLAI